MVENNQNQHETKTVYNFSPGPGILPKAVLREAQEKLMDYNGTGLSVMEMSHRSKAFIEIAEKARADLRTLLAIPDNFQVFMFQGGATMQFSAICYNLLEDGDQQTANYLNTGTWSQLAIKEASKYCSVNEVASNLADDYKTLAGHEEWNIDPNAKFFHYCDNETIQGFEFHNFPYDKIPEGQTLVADMSSNFCTRPIDWAKHGVVYAGASKNVGPAGVTFVVVRNDLIAGHRSDTPMLCDWETFNKAANTFHNTPSCWTIYMCGLNIAYMIEQGGLAGMEAKAEERAALFYSFIDGSDGYYTNKIEPTYRSRINIPFRICNNEALEAKFLVDSTAANLLDLKSFKLDKGCRASFYNAMPVEGVRALIAFMTQFKADNPTPASE